MVKSKTSKTYERKQKLRQMFERRGRKPKVLATLQDNFDNDFLLMAYSYMLDENEPRKDRMQLSASIYGTHRKIKSNEKIASDRVKQIGDIGTILSIIDACHNKLREVSPKAIPANLTTVEAEVLPQNTDKPANSDTY